MTGVTDRTRRLLRYLALRQREWFYVATLLGTLIAATGVLVYSHPLREIRRITDVVLKSLSGEFDSLVLATHTRAQSKAGPKPSTMSAMVISSGARAIRTISSPAENVPS